MHFKSRRVHEPDPVREARRAGSEVYVVWSPERWAPSVAYATYGAALEEAQRLKRRYPEFDYYVMAAVSRLEG